MTLDAGTLLVRPGAALPTIRSTRREWAPLIGQGRPADELPARLALVYSLCGGAHRVAAGHAVAAARGAAPEVGPAARHALRVDTVREHLRRLWLDAPRLVEAAEAPEPAELAGCAWMQRADALAEGRTWIEAHVLGADAERWLAHWEADPAGFAARWSAQGRTWPARWLATQLRRLGGLQQRVLALSVHAEPGGLLRLAASLEAEDGFAMAPTWHGQTAETGCWTRLADHLARGDEPPCTVIGLRHGARLADLARLVAPAGDRWLAQGGLALGGGAGLGWCEMARGLLVHRVRIDADGTVADNRLIAPTEWNFHPFGAAAQALATLAPGAAPPLVRSVVAAFDPCVSITLDP